MNSNLHALIEAMTDPVGNVRAVKRMLAMGSITKDHLQRIPPDDSQSQLNQRANIWAKTLLQAMGVDLTVTGRPTPGALLVSNHRSYVDILLLLAGTPCCFLAKGDVADWPVIGVAASRVGTVYVDRHAKDSRKASREAIARLLDAGHTVVVFPEGTTYPGPGCQDFRLGAFEVAHEVGAPVLPVALEYGRASDAWRDEHVLVHFSRCFRQPKIKATLSFGPPLYADEPLDLMHDAHQWMNTTLHTLWQDVVP